jgi:hypothetical protein
MFNRFFHKKKKPARTYRNVVWGIWTPPELKADYIGLAHKLDVPVWVLAVHVLRQWLQKNNEILQNDIVLQRQFESFLIREYRKNSRVEN